MRHILLLLLLPTLLRSEELDLPDGFEADPERPDTALSFSAVRKYYKEKDEIQAKYRTRLSGAMEHADAAEILLLSFTMEKEIPDGEEGNYILISPYGTYSKILDRKKLRGDSISQCKDHTVSLLKKPYSPGAMCHFPIHGIRLYRGEELIFETSLCWQCSNYFLEYPDDFEKGSWVGFGKSEIEAFLKKELPIPQSEIDRFEAKYGEKKSKPVPEDGAEQPATRSETDSESDDRQ